MPLLLPLRWFCIPVLCLLCYPVIHVLYLVPVYFVQFWFNFMYFYVSVFTLCQILFPSFWPQCGFLSFHYYFPSIIRYGFSPFDKRTEKAGVFHPTWCLPFWQRVVGIRIIVLHKHYGRFPPYIQELGQDVQTLMLYLLLSWPNSPTCVNLSSFSGYRSNRTSIPIDINQSSTWCFHPPFHNFKSEFHKTYSLYRRYREKFVKLD